MKRRRRVTTVMSITIRVKADKKPISTVLCHLSEYFYTTITALYYHDYIFLKHLTIELRDVDKLSFQFILLAENQLLCPIASIAAYMRDEDRTWPIRFSASSLTPSGCFTN